MTQVNAKHKSLFLMSLGCPKNLVDSEVMLGLLGQEGYVVVENPEDADLLLVNTCGFIQSAVEEAIEEILGLVGLKAAHPEKYLVVTGCLVQRYGEKLKREMPEVDLFVGTEGFQEISTRIRQAQAGEIEAYQQLAIPRFIMGETTPRQVSTPSHRAYMKITEGCSNRCSFCIIPSLRGRLRSRNPDDLVREAQRLSGAGVQELTLVGQDLTSYGIDLGLKNVNLKVLLRDLLASCDIPWIRLLYLYPPRLKEDFLEFMASNPRIVPYVDIPLQHVSKRVLKAMNRPHDSTRPGDLVDRIRNIVSPVAIRSTFIVGFPGETEEDVAELESFIRTKRLDHVGVFTYSNEEGCAAESFDNQCPEEVKNERRDRLMEIQAGISLENNQSYIGKTEQVLVEGVSRETELLLEGRTRFQAPEIDGCVYINEGICRPGEIVEVTISEAHTYDLVGHCSTQAAP